VQLLLDGIAEILIARGRLELRGFGILEVRHRKSRQGRNPLTGASVSVPERKAIRFQAGKYMVERVNGEVESGEPDADGSRRRILRATLSINRKKRDSKMNIGKWAALALLDIHVL